MQKTINRPQAHYHGIKLVWEEIFEDFLADQRMGFPPKYDKKFFLPKESKMLVYVTGVKRIFVVNVVTGTWDDGQRLYSPGGRFPLCLPIKETYRSQTGVTLQEIQQVVPTFKPYKGLSYFPLDADSYDVLEKVLKSK